MWERIKLRNNNSLFSTHTRAGARKECYIICDKFCSLERAYGYCQHYDPLQSVCVALHMYGLILSYRRMYWWSKKCCITLILYATTHSALFLSSKNWHNQTCFQFSVKYRLFSFDSVNTSKLPNVPSFCFQPHNYIPIFSFWFVVLREQCLKKQTLNAVTNEY